MTPKQVETKQFSNPRTCFTSVVVVLAISTHRIFDFFFPNAVALCHVRAIGVRMYVREHVVFHTLFLRCAYTPPMLVPRLQQ